MNKLALIAVAAALALAACGKGEQKQAAAPPATAPSTAPAQTPAAVPDPYYNATFSDPVLTKGHQVFKTWCAPCHSPGPLHPGTQALEALYKGAKPAPLEERTDLTPDITKTFVRTGVSIMPPFRKTEITDAELEDLAAYLARPR